MLDLTRTVRFALNPAGPDGDARAPRHNTFSAWPPPRGLARYYELHVTCRGRADPQTGYFINIKHIDAAVREHALPRLRAAVADESAAANVPLGRLLRDLLADLQPPLDHRVVGLELQLTPYLSYQLRQPLPPSTAPDADERSARATPTPTMPDHVLIKQQYEFSAAHRLHVPEHSDDQNLETFGKCNNPAGHGHNYRVQVVARCAIDPAGRTASAADLDAVVDAALIQPLDHKHLNVDVPQFARLNPSVEHIAAVAWDLLADPLAQALPGSELDELTVWETTKTACTYRGPAS